MKRSFDFALSLMLLIVFFPLLTIFAACIYAQDGSNPLYISERVGKKNRKFKMYKLRSMVVGADKSGVDSTAGDDKRITKIGILVRKFKLDELVQLLNVLKGDMSLVGPRPNVERETKQYSDEEKKLLSIKPGITDYASIVFSDESDILSGADNPDLSYNQLIRPGKSRLGIFYVENQSFLADLAIVFVTALSIFNRKLALQSVSRILVMTGAPESLMLLALREQPLKPSPPPGYDEIVQSREI